MALTQEWSTVPSDGGGEMLIAYSPLIAISTILFLSLLAAVILFKFLESSAIIEKREHRVGGALAGFLLIFSSLSLTYIRLDPHPANVPQKTWTISGFVDYRGETSFSDLRIEPAPDQLSVVGNDGKFSLRNVPWVDDTLIELYVGETGQTLLLDNENSRINELTKVIRLRDPWKLVDQSVSNEVTAEFLDGH